MQLKQFLISALLFLSSIIYAQDTSIVSYMQVMGDNGQKLLLPIETPTIHDTIRYYTGEFEYDTLSTIHFTYIDEQRHISYGEGYLMEELLIWHSDNGNIRQSIQHYIKRGKRRFYFKNLLVDQDEFSSVFLNSIPRHRKWWQKKDYYILDIYER